MAVCQLLACSAAALPDALTGNTIAPALESFGPAMAAANASDPATRSTALVQPLLSTRDGKIVDVNGTEVILNGIGW